METFNTIIEKATKHDSEALNTLITLMTPLLRKYASKIHFMDFDDAMQELSLTLVECLKFSELHNYMRLLNNPGSVSLLSRLRGSSAINRFSFSYID